jgi:hypothetical protein
VKHCIDIAHGKCFVVGHRKKVAVDAFLDAEGNVDIEGINHCLYLISSEESS